jgi:omega-6 fatty acid desaturase (delta-12 desaturase)
MESSSSSFLSFSDLYQKYKASYRGAGLDLSRHFLFKILTFYLMYSLNHQLFFQLLLVPLLTLLNIKTFIIFHDCIHDSYTPSPQWNHWIAHATGIFVFVSPNWGIDHLTHHLTNGNKENSYHYKFNELIDYTVDEYQELTSLGKLTYRIFYNAPVYFSLFPLLYFFI